MNRLLLTFTSHKRPVDTVSTGYRPKFGHARMSLTDGSWRHDRFSYRMMKGGGHGKVKLGNLRECESLNPKLAPGSVTLFR